MLVADLRTRSEEPVLTSGRIIATIGIDTVRQNTQNASSQIMLVIFTIPLQDRVVLIYFTLEKLQMQILW